MQSIKYTILLIGSILIIVLLLSTNAKLNNLENQVESLMMQLSSVSRPSEPVETNRFIHSDNHFELIEETNEFEIRRITFSFDRLPANPEIKLVLEEAKAFKYQPTQGYSGYDDLFSDEFSNVITTTHSFKQSDDFTFFVDVTFSKKKNYKMSLLYKSNDGTLKNELGAYRLGTISMPAFSSYAFLSRKQNTVRHLGEINVQLKDYSLGKYSDIDFPYYENSDLLSDLYNIDMPGAKVTHARVDLYFMDRLLLEKEVPLEQDEYFNKFQAYEIVIPFDITRAEDEKEDFNVNPYKLILHVFTENGEEHSAVFENQY